MGTLITQSIDQPSQSISESISQAADWSVNTSAIQSFNQCINETQQKFHETMNGEGEQFTRAVSCNVVTDHRKHASIYTESPTQTMCPAISLPMVLDYKQLSCRTKMDRSQHSER